MAATSANQVPFAAPPRGLDEVRQAIDQVDQELVELLNRRAALALDAGRLKAKTQAPVYAPERESMVLDKVSNAGEGPLDPASLRAIFGEVISACRGIQHQVTVGYLGPEHTFSHQAARQRFGDSSRLVALDSIDEVFGQVERGGLSLGLVPVENSCEGPVERTLANLVSTRLRVCGESYLSVEHCLMASGNASQPVETVYSHPQALGQCRSWLRRNLPQARLAPCPSTAQAAAQAAQEPGAAAIGGRGLASAHGLEIVAAGIQDQATNLTRFLLLGHEDCAPTGRDKSSLVFRVRHQPGTLVRALEIMAARKLNLVNIVSRPVPHTTWEYQFFAEFTGHREEPGTAEALAELTQMTMELRVLGSYPAEASRPRARHLSAQGGEA